MDGPTRRRLEEIYRRYGFEVARNYEQDQVVVFTLKTGYFDNADIVPLSESAQTDRAFKDFTDTGYACTRRPVLTPEEAEKQLFKGFFSVESILDRLENAYIRFTSSIVAPFSVDAKYEYINAPYLVNSKAGTTSPAEEVLSRLSEVKPTLFLIEAAAGFGKTCTAFELVHLLRERGEHLPLFSELSRNRQARVFRYILLDEIDRTFPVLGSRLVQAEMVNGRVITILDGFDELLRKTDDASEFENREPMLETIGQFLTGNAKIVLTTRRTVLFEGDAFHTWVEKHADDFDLIRIKINEPQVSDWLSVERYDALKRSDLNIVNVANPVLLSYLRCIPDAEFWKVMETPHELVNRYFEFMLDRERVRQDLRMDGSMQQQVLSSIAEDMMEFGYTSEQRDYIVDHIQRSNSKLLDEALLAYPATERPDREEIANKLASHALLDRSSREANKIGFVNEFVFGHFIAQTILKSDGWLSDDPRFIEPAVVSYQPRPSSVRLALWEKLQGSTEFLPISDRIDICIRLKKSIDFDLISEEAEGLEIDGVLIGEKVVENFQFNECIFRNCVFRISSFSNASFLNCRFYGNTIEIGSAAGAIHLLGPTGDAEFIQQFIASLGPAPVSIEPDRELLLSRFVLEKFWPVGRDTLMHKHRPIKGLCVGGSEFRPTELYEAITLLKKRGILLAPMRASFVEINFDELPAIRSILNR